MAGQGLKINSFANYGWKKDYSGNQLFFRSDRLYFLTLQDANSMAKAAKAAPGAGVFLDSGAAWV